MPGLWTATVAVAPLRVLSTVRQQSSMTAPHICANCGGPKAIFIRDNNNYCRHCTDIPQEHRPALNALLKAGLIYAKDSP